MVLVMSLAGCGSGDNREKVGQTTKTQEAVEPSGSLVVELKADLI